MRTRRVHNPVLDHVQDARRPRRRAPVLGPAAYAIPTTRAAYHRDSEEAVKASGALWTIMCPVATALTDAGHAGETYRVSGPEALTPADQVVLMGKVP
jgi:hypothetical protein